jgi:hypothetical protein
VPAFLLQNVLSFGKGQDWSAELEGIRTFHLGLRFQKDVALVGEFQCADDAAADRLRGLLERQQLLGLGRIKLAETQPAALTWAPAYAWAAAPLPTTTALVAVVWQHERQVRDAEAHWVSMQVRGTPGQLRLALRR